MALEKEEVRTAQLTEVYGDTRKRFALIPRTRLESELSDSIDFDVEYSLQLPVPQIQEAVHQLEVIDLPLPPPLEYDGARVPASYANFYIMNTAVLVPIFGVATDEPVLQMLRELFPERQVRGVPSRVLIRGLGSVHCLTQQQPALPRDHCC